MKAINKVIVSLIILTLLKSTGFSQSGWISQISNTSEHLHDIQFLNVNTGYACGKNGAILKTVNGGLFWTLLTGFTNNDLSKLYFIDSNTGWVIVTGSNPEGTDIYKTSNGGLNFYIQFHDSSIPTEIDMYFLDLDNGWACSPGMLLHTTNGGMNWIQYIQPLGSQIYFINNNTGFLLNNFEFFKTTNNGQNWTMSSNNLIHLRYSIFYNSNTGYALGRNQSFYKTSNGGNNWNNITIVNNINYNFNSAYFLDINTGWAVTYAPDSNRGLVYKTISGGINWNLQYVGVDQEIKSINFVDANTGWIAGYNGIIYRTTTGGEPIGILQLGNEIPSKYYLSQNYPNPFNPSTFINFEIPEKISVKLTIYNINGKEAVILINKVLNPGSYRIDWDASLLSSGTYFYRLETDDFTKTKRMILLK